MDTEKLRQWFLAEKRDLPWRNQPSPYAVWVSEVMLQQTQVSVVIPYFLRWMEQFPTIQALAEASLDEVIKAWEGLGYYSRVRYLHEGARYAVAHFNGELPSTEEGLKHIKGLGPYTRGAILSFAFRQKRAAVDGNVLRVLARYFQIEEDIAKPITIKKLQGIAEKILPDQEPWIISEALIELGATVCQKKAQCHKCPLKESCLSYQQGVVERLPIKSKGPKTQYLYRAVAVIRCQDLYLVKRGEKGRIMSDLHEFPFFEVGKEGITEEELKVKVKQVYKGATSIVFRLPSVDQSFTRYQVRLDPVLLECATPFTIEGLQWLSLPALKKLAFSSGHRRIFQLVQTFKLIS